MTTASKMIREYAATQEEVEHLGRALLCRHENLSDASYCYGQDNYPAELAAIAKALDWAA